MTSHSVQLTVERKVDASEALNGLKGDARKGPETPAQNADVAPAPAQPKKSGGTLKRVLMLGAAIAAIGAGGYYGYGYWTVGRFQVSTDDAYVQADNVTIAPKISGYLAQVLVGDNQPVKTGQVLATIDDRDYRTALEQAQSDVAVAAAIIDSKKAALETQNSVIDGAKATIAVDQANLTFAEQENQRYTDLAKSTYGSVQNAQNASSHLLSARASLQRDTAALASALKQVDQLKADLAQAQAQQLHDQAVERQAELNLSYTKIVAPSDGVVGNRTLRVGQYVAAGTQLMAVVPLSAAYVVANYKETQLTDVKAGQPVDIEVDMFPGKVFHGRVDSLAPSSGQTFSLLPPDNATGNFTKVVQRIPVRISLDGDVEALGELRPGMSVEPSIDTLAKPAATRTASATE